MEKRRTFYFPVVVIFLITVSAFTAAAQEVTYISEPAFLDTPKILPRADASLWNMDFRCNPALLKLECPYEFIYDTYYLGSYDRKSTSDYANGTLFDPATYAYFSSSVESKYYTDAVGGDLGFAMKLNDRSNLAFIFNYRYGNVLGDGTFVNAWDDGRTGENGYLDGSLEQKLESNTFAASVLWNMKFSEAFTLGAALKYAYTSETFRDEIWGNSVTLSEPGTLSMERDQSLKYHYISPKVGISFVPSDRFTLNASVAAGFYIGGTVDKSASLSDSFEGFATPPYTEDLDSSDISGWDIAAKVRPEFKVSDTLAIPVVVDFRYKDFTWGVDGASNGYFAPISYSGIFQGPGTIDYENEATTWDITAGAGVKYDAGWATLSGMLSYTHWDFNNTYDQNNLVVLGNAGGLTSFSQDDTETRDIISLGLTLEKQFSPKLSADFGVCYDFGWGHRRYDLTYLSPFEAVSFETLSISTEGDATYQDLTLSTHMTFAPVQRLSITLGGFVTMPLQSLDYRLDGASAGLTANNVMAAYPWTGPDGPISRDYENIGWNYGGLLSISYEFGCPVAVPPVIPTPVIEPKLEPMSFK